MDGLKKKRVQHFCCTLYCKTNIVLWFELKSKIQTTKRKRLVKLLLEAGPLACALAQIIQLRSPNMGMSLHRDFFDARRAGEKCALHADTVTRHASYGKTGIVGAIALADDHAFELLHAFVVAFFNSQENADQVANS